MFSPYLDGVSYSKSRGFPGSYVPSVVRSNCWIFKEKELAQARAAKTGNGSEEAPCDDDDDDDDDGDDSFLNGGHGRISWISHCHQLTEFAPHLPILEELEFYIRGD